MERSVALLTLFLLAALPIGTLRADLAQPAPACATAPPPLVALCNAYCEALDCDAAPVAGTEGACARLLGDYIARSKGKRPPCMASCPELCAEARDGAVARCEERFAWILEKCDTALVACLTACPTCDACLADHGSCAATWSRQLEACSAPTARQLADCTQSCPDARAAR